MVVIFFLVLFLFVLLGFDFTFHNFLLVVLLVNLSKPFLLLVFVVLVVVVVAMHWSTIVRVPQVVDNDNVIVGRIDNMILFVILTVRIVMFFFFFLKDTS